AGWVTALEQVLPRRQQPQPRVGQQTMLKSAGQVAEPVPGSQPGSPLLCVHENSEDCRPADS
ncbi:hypothetical protein, partial [Salmonella enterica]|uniref:hypothetical protein n=1 Tax=Salmonella enterica TaxID=28901 RepID=UPI0021B26380